MGQSKKDIFQHDDVLQAQNMVLLGRLSAGVAHDINNPLTFLTTNLEYLLKKVESGNVPDKATLAAILSETLCGAERIKRTVQDLLTFVHPDKGELAPLDLNEILDSAVKVLLRDVRLKAEVVKKYQNISKIWLDSNQTGQVFYNLVENAIQALKPGGVIELSSGEDTREVFVSIKDNGCGISPEIQARLFEPFFTTRGGTGLGLYLSRKIIGSFGGRIVVESALGLGSKFTVFFPREARDAR
jgi:two-component system, NtrC family, sensor kinase